MNIKKKKSAMKPMIATLPLAAMPLYTIGEEIANSIIHGVGALAAVVGLVFMVLKALGVFDVPAVGTLAAVSIVIFTATMIGMFLVSTLYHAIQHEGAKRVFRRLDHSLIFIFIAGTYTPFCLISLRGAWGWSLFAFEWAMAITGILLNIFGSKKLKKLEIAAYVLMGWAVVIGIVPLARAIPIQSIILIFAGGLAYTLGIIWYRKKHIKLTHVVWHIFVLAGTICHWFSIWWII